MRSILDSRKKEDRQEKRTNIPSSSCFRRASPREAVNRMFFSMAQRDLLTERREHRKHRFDGKNMKGESCQKISETKRDDEPVRNIASK